MDTAAWIAVVTALITGVGIPLLIAMQNKQSTATDRQDAARSEQFGSVHKRLDHLDGCIDDVRGVIYSKGVTREELITFKADITETINRMRTAISNETNGLHQRIMRLEDTRFVARKDGDG